MTHTTLSQRQEFVRLAQQADVNFRELCRRFGISAKTGYKWRNRHRAGGDEALTERSRRPKTHPGLCSAEVTGRVLELRREHPSWGGRKLRRRLQDLGEAKAPAASTCTAIVRRSGLPMGESAKHTADIRFERTWPNELWQMDFKGHFGTLAGHRCHPLTVLDDHSRYNLVLAACANEQTTTVCSSLTDAFKCHGLPAAILCDNGAPWGRGDDQSPHTALSVWLLRLGVRVLHGRPYHPQTQGKDERFHRTLNQDLIQTRTWSDLAHCAREFPRFRHVYNCERPHDALAGATPLSCYQPSPRSMPSTLPLPEYPSSDTVRVVRSAGMLTFGAQTWLIGRAFVGLPVGLRPSAQADGQWEVFFSHHRLGLIDLTSSRLPKHRLRSIYSASLSLP